MNQQRQGKAPPLMSEQVGELFAGYVAAQEHIDNVLQDREVEVPIKDKQNPGSFKGKYRFRYATLPAILNHIREALNSNGIWYTQFALDGDMVTRLMHKSGQWMDTGHVPLPDIKGDPAAIGAIISFFKRYSLTAAMGLASDDDDSGEQGDRDVTFHARGAPQQQQNAAPEIIEPAIGWGDWARGLIDQVGKRNTEQELDELRDNNIEFINGCSTFDGKMARDIRETFRARRSVIADKPF